MIDVQASATGVVPRGAPATSIAVARCVSADVADARRAVLRAGLEAPVATRERVVVRSCAADENRGVSARTEARGPQLRRIGA